VAKGGFFSKGTKNKHKEGTSIRLEYKEHKLTIIANY
jgi:hypothetical protein